MSRRGFAVVFLAGFAAVALLACPAQAIIIGPTHDPNDNSDAVREVAREPRVEVFRGEVDAARKRLLHWKLRDFVAVFGKATKPETLKDALMIVEPRMIGLSGLHSSNPADNKDHVDAYPVADLGHLVVYFGHDGEAPVLLLFYLKTDGDFPRLDRPKTLEKRLAWERPRFARLLAEVERRWRNRVGWEIDPDAEKARSQGLESGDFAVKLRAVKRWAKELGYTYGQEEREGEVSRWWLEGETIRAEAYHDRGYKGREATPSVFKFYRPDGTLLRDETGWPSLEMIRWYRPDGERMAYVETGSVHHGPWRVREWSWYDRKGEVVRVEEDSNGDGIPDVQGKSNLFDQRLHTPLPVDRSWAVNPALIPEDLRNPGQPERRLVLRRIAE